MELRDIKDCQCSEMENTCEETQNTLRQHQILHHEERAPIHKAPIFILFIDFENVDQVSAMILGHFP